LKEFINLKEPMYDPKNGYGTVAFIDETTPNSSIFVDFGHGAIRVYTGEGKNRFNKNYRSLFKLDKNEKAIMYLPTTMIYQSFCHTISNFNTAWEEWYEWFINNYKDLPEREWVLIYDHVKDLLDETEIKGEIKEVLFNMLKLMDEC